MQPLKFRARLTHPDGTPYLFYQNDQYLISFLRRVTSHIKGAEVTDQEFDFGVHEKYLEEPLEEYLDQWTGLKDCKNKDIYKGDLIKWRDKIFEVTYCNGAFKVMETKNMFEATDGWLHEMAGHFCKCESQVNDIEIIGNVHTTPELIP